MLTTSDTFTDALTAELARWRLRVEPSAVHAMRSHFVAMVEVNPARQPHADHRSVLGSRQAPTPIHWRCCGGSRMRACVMSLQSWTSARGLVSRRYRWRSRGRDWTVIAIDGTKKKVDFLARWAQSAEPPATTPNASNLTAIHAHSSQWTLNPPVDLVVCRALAPLARCIELAVPFLHAGGRIAAYKSRDLPGSEEHAARRGVPSPQPERAPITRV